MAMVASVEVPLLVHHRLRWDADMAFSRRQAVLLLVALARRRGHLLDSLSATSRSTLLEMMANKSTMVHYLELKRSLLVHRFRSAWTGWIVSSRG